MPLVDAAPASQPNPAAPRPSASVDTALNNQSLAAPTAPLTASPAARAQFVTPTTLGQLAQESQIIAAWDGPMAGAAGQSPLFEAPVARPRVNQSGVRIATLERTQEYNPDDPQNSGIFETLRDMPQAMRAGLLPGNSREYHGHDPFQQGAATEHRADINRRVEAIRSLQLTPEEKKRADAEYEGLAAEEKAKTSAEKIAQEHLQRKKDWHLDNMLEDTNDIYLVRQVKQGAAVDTYRQIAETMKSLMAQGDQAATLKYMREAFHGRSQAEVVEIALQYDAHCRPERRREGQIFNPDTLPQDIERHFTVRKAAAYNRQAEKEGKEKLDDVFTTVGPGGKTYACLEAQFLGKGWDPRKSPAEVASRVALTITENRTLGRLGVGVATENWVGSMGSIAEALGLKEMGSAPRKYVANLVANLTPEQEEACVQYWEEEARAPEEGPLADAQRVVMTMANQGYQYQGFQGAVEYITQGPPADEKAVELASSVPAMIKARAELKQLYTDKFNEINQPQANLTDEEKAALQEEAAKQAAVFVSRHEAFKKALEEIITELTRETNVKPKLLADTLDGVYPDKAELCFF